MECVWLTCGLAIGIGLFACGPRGPQVEKSHGKQQAGQTSFLTFHLVKIEPISGRVSFVSDGALGVRDSAGAWQKEFTLGPGETFFPQIDEHSSSSFEVMELNPNSVALKYKSTWDHRSFGRNLITTDEGELEIAFTNKPVSAGVPGQEQPCEDPVAIKREFEAAVKTTSSCFEDSDCQAVAIVRCPLGCHVAVAKENVASVLALAKALVDRIPPHCRCLYKCGALPEHAYCVSGSCTLKRGP